MNDCKFLAINDVTPYHGDVFDHILYDENEREE